MNSLKTFWQKYHSLISCYLVAMLMFIGISIFKPGFASVSHMRILASETAIIGIVAIGQTLVIITGGIDLSVAWNVGIAAIMVTNLKDAMPLPVLILVILATTTLFGAINGAGIAYLNIPPIVMTLGMNTVLQGGLVAMTKGAPGNSAPEIIKTLGQGNFLGIPVLIIIWAALTAITMLLMFKMRFGRELFVVGNNPVAAHYSGINGRRVKLMAYAMCGLTAGMAGILQTGKVGQSYLGIGEVFQFQSIAAAAIGGTSMMGGSGNYLGTVAGAFTITILLGILAALNLPYGVQRMAYGLVVLISVLMSVRRGRKKDALVA